MGCSFMRTVPFKLPVGKPLERPQDRSQEALAPSPGQKGLAGARVRAPLPGTQAWRRALPRLPIGAHAPSCHGRPGPAPWALPEWTVPGHANEGLVAAAHWPAAECR